MVNQNLTSARPGRPKSPAKREAIRGCASELFLKEGFQKTSMDAVASGAGVSKQTVYSHFDNKDELFRACIAGKVADHGLDARLFSADLAVEEALLAIGSQLMDLFCDTQVVAMHRVLAGECVAHPGLAAVFHQAGPMKTKTALADYLAERRDAGELEFEDAMDAADTFIALIRRRYFMEMVLNVRDGVDDGERMAHVSRTVGQFLKIYGATAGRRSA